MKIIKVADKKVKGKQYYKYRVTLPKDVVDKSKFSGKLLKAKFDKGKIIIEKYSRFFIQKDLNSSGT